MSQRFVYQEEVWDGGWAALTQELFSPLQPVAAVTPQNIGFKLHKQELRHILSPLLYNKYSF